MLKSFILSSRSKKLALTLSLVTISLTLNGCKSGYNVLYENGTADEDAPSCNSQPSNTNLSASALRVYDLIVDLSCERIPDFVLSGQSTGNGNEISGNDNFRSYNALINQLTQDTGNTPAIVAIDYEKTAQFSSTQLTEANGTLETHHNNSGLVSISWTPLNPWAPNSSNPLAATEDTDLTVLYGTDTTNAVYTAFNDRLTLIIEQLNALDDLNIPVLFSPLPSMNTDEYWYGAHSDNTEAEFRALWQHIYTRVNTQVNNVIWVYAPRSGTTAQRVSALWGYPSNVDVIAGISLSNEINITDYTSYRDQNKPLGMTRLAPSTADGTFDNTLYASELTGRFPFVAYWIADHDTDNSSQPNSSDILRSLINNEKEDSLLSNENIATTQTLISEQWLSN